MEHKHATTPVVPRCVTAIRRWRLRSAADAWPSTAPQSDRPTASKRCRWRTMRLRRPRSADAGWRSSRCSPALHAAIRPGSESPRPGHRQRTGTWTSSSGPRCPGWRQGPAGRRRTRSSGRYTPALHPLSRRSAYADWGGGCAGDCGRGVTVGILTALGGRQAACRGLVAVGLSLAEWFWRGACLERRGRRGGRAGWCRPVDGRAEDDDGGVDAGQEAHRGSVARHVCGDLLAGKRGVCQGGGGGVFGEASLVAHGLSAPLVLVVTSGSEVRPARSGRQTRSTAAVATVSRVMRCSHPLPMDVTFGPARWVSGARQGGGSEGRSPVWAARSTSA